MKNIPHHWYALITRSRFEKKAAEDLTRKGITAFLPLTTEFRKWSDRMKKVQVPLIRSYVFAKTNPSDYYHYQSVLQAVGAARIVSFEGIPAKVPDHQIEALQRLTEMGLTLQVESGNLPPGTPVEISRGPLKGIKGIVVRTGKKHLLVIRLDIADKNIQVTLPEELVEELKDAQA